MSDPNEAQYEEICPYCGSDNVEAIEYDHDDDLFRMYCNNGHHFWFRDEDMPHK